MSKILILDLETTGFLNQNGKIVEIGIVELDLSNGDRKIIYNQVCHEKGITMQEVSDSWIVQNSDLNLELIKYWEQLHLTILSILVFVKLKDLYFLKNYNVQ